jgi:hypothetical protein
LTRKAEVADLAKAIAEVGRKTGVDALPKRLSSPNFNWDAAVNRDWKDRDPRISGRSGEQLEPLHRSEHPTKHPLVVRGLLLFALFARLALFLRIGALLDVSIGGYSLRGSNPSPDSAGTDVTSPKTVSFTVGRVQ